MGLIGARRQLALPPAGGAVGLSGPSTNTNGQRRPGVRARRAVTHNDLRTTESLPLRLVSQG